MNEQKEALELANVKARFCEHLMRDSFIKGHNSQLHLHVHRERSVWYQWNYFVVDDKLKVETKKIPINKLRAREKIIQAFKVEEREGKLFEKKTTVYIRTNDVNSKRKQFYVNEVSFWRCFNDNSF